MIDELRNNIELEIEMVRELSEFIEKSENSSPSEKRMLSGIISSLKRRIKLINDTIPSIVKDTTLSQQLIPSTKSKDTESIRIKKTGITNVVLKKENKREFLEQLNINENLIKKIRKKSQEEKLEIVEFKGASAYGKLANKYFLDSVYKYIKKGYFKSLILNIKRSNLNILTTTYISMAMFTVLLSVFFGFALAVFLLFFKISFAFPFFSVYDGSLIGRFAKTFWVVLAVPVCTAGIMYLYPGAERKSLAKRIEQELPFVVIHMGAISGSGIAPARIFKIIGMSREYKYAGKEIRKVLNQINIYGYDLTTALKNVSRSTPSVKLAELFNGLNVTVNSGGNIKTFFEKRSESLLLEYRLERERFTKSAETFMDIYISVVIVAPMIMLLLLIMISVTGFNIGLSLKELSLVVVGIVVIINIIFLTLLHLKQPGY